MLVFLNILSVDLNLTLSYANFTTSITIMWTVMCKETVSNWKIVFVRTRRRSVWNWNPFWRMKCCARQNYLFLSQSRWNWRARRGEGAVGAFALPDFGRCINSILIRWGGADCAHHISTCPTHPDFQTFLRPCYGAVKQTWKCKTNYGYLIIHGHRSLFTFFEDDSTADIHTRPSAYRIIPP